MESCDLCMSTRFGGIGHVCNYLLRWRTFVMVEKGVDRGGRDSSGRSRRNYSRFQPFVQTQPRNRRNHTLIILYIGIGIGRNSPQR